MSGGWLLAGMFLIVQVAGKNRVTTETDAFLPARRVC